MHIVIVQKHIYSKIIWRQVGCYLESHRKFTSYLKKQMLLPVILYVFSLPEFFLWSLKHSESSVHSEMAISTIIQLQLSLLTKNLYIVNMIFLIAFSFFVAVTLYKSCTLFASKMQILRNLVWSNSYTKILCHLGNFAIYFNFVFSIERLSRS